MELARNNGRKLIGMRSKNFSAAMVRFRSSTDGGMRCRN